MGIAPAGKLPRRHPHRKTLAFQRPARPAPTTGEDVAVGARGKGPQSLRVRSRQALSRPRTTAKALPQQPLLRPRLLLLSRRPAPGREPSGKTAASAAVARRPSRVTPIARTAPGREDKTAAAVGRVEAVKGPMATARVPGAVSAPSRSRRAMGLGGVRGSLGAAVPPVSSVPWITPIARSTAT